MNALSGDVRVLFLLGVMRSGTTFFRNVLGSNPSVLVLGSELNRFWTQVADAPCGAVARCEPRDAEDASEEIRRAVRGYFEGRYRQRNAVSRIAYRAYRQIRYGNERLIKRGTPFYLLNKSTHLLNKIEFVNAIFPESRFIFLVRDIRSNSNSLYNHLARYEAARGKTPSYPGKDGLCWSFDPAAPGRGFRADFASIPSYWIEQNALAMRSLDGLNHRRVLYLRYEDLLNGLSDVLDRVSDFLELEYGLLQVNRRLINNTSDDPLNSWRRSLEPAQLSAIEDVLVRHDADFRFVASHLDFRP